MATIQQFVNFSYKLINPSNPPQPLQGNDLSDALFLLNQLLTTYASDGLMLTVASTQTTALAIAQETVVIGPPTFLPLPDIIAGRPASWDSAWVELTGVDYPLIFKTRDEWLSSFKYNPLQGLPRFIIPFPDVQTVTFRIYPAPSQYFQFYLRGKFQLTPYTSVSDTMTTLPGYYNRYLMFALAKEIAMFKGRASAWTPILEQSLVDATNNMASTSEVNLAIVGDEESLLNGSWRVKAGV